MAADQPKALFVFGAEAVFQKEEMIRLQFLRKPSRLNRCKPLVDIVKKLDLIAQFVSQMREQFRYRPQICARLPRFDGRHRVSVAPPSRHRIRRSPCRGSGFLRASDTVCPDRARYRDLRSNDLEAAFRCAAHLVFDFVEIPAARVCVAKYALTGFTAEQRVDRQIGAFAFDVPERGVDPGERGHQHRTAPPVGASKKHLPDVFDAVGVVTDQQRRDMFRDRRGDSEFATVERRIPHPVETRLIGHDFDDDIVTRRAGHDDAHFRDTHEQLLCSSFEKIKI